MQRFLALIGRVELKGQAIDGQRAEQGLFRARQRLFVVDRGTQDLAKVLMNRGRVVDDQNAPVGSHERRFHPLSSVERCGLSRIGPMSWLGGTILPAFSSSAAC